MSAQSAIGAACAVGVLAESKAIGTQVNLTHRANAPVTLYATIVKLTTGGTIIQRGRQVELGEIVIRVATGQAGFAVMTTTARPVTPGDVIEYPTGSGRTFIIPRDNDIIQLSYGYVYEIHGIERKSITLGAATGKV